MLVLALVDLSWLLLRLLPKRSLELSKLYEADTDPLPFAAAIYYELVERS